MSQSAFKNLTRREQRNHLIVQLSRFTKALIGKDTAFIKAHSDRIEEIIMHFLPLSERIISIF
jgi:hypothetical protein